MTTGIASPGSCCPEIMGEVCWNDGANSGRAFAIYDPVTESAKYLDVVTGDVVASSSIIACADAVDWGTANATATLASVTAAGATAAGLSSVTITNVGAAAGTVQGVAFPVGASITYNAYADPVSKTFRRLPAIAYNGAGTALLVATLS